MAVAAMAVRISLGSAGLWCTVFTIPTLMTPLLAGWGGPCSTPVRGAHSGGSGARQVAAVRGGYPALSAEHDVLIAYLLYNQTRFRRMLALASQFGNDELKIPVS